MRLDEESARLEGWDDMDEWSLLVLRRKGGIAFLLLGFAGICTSRSRRRAVLGAIASGHGVNKVVFGF